MPTVAPPDSTPRASLRAFVWAGWAALLSQGSPLGALALRWGLTGSAPGTELAEHGLLYGYMSLATLLVFAGFGYVLGRLADDLVRGESALRHANRRLRRLSEVDTLTGVLNRRALYRRLRAELRRAQREGGTTAVILLDLDHFKQINDRHGHVAGDRVLRRVGRHLRRCARASDSVGRMGGEEFLIVLPATSLQEASQFAERLRGEIAGRPDAPDMPRVTASLGVTVCEGAGLRRVEGVLREADAAMYRAKAEGRDRVGT